MTDDDLLREVGDACRRAGQCPTCGGATDLDGLHRASLYDVLYERIVRYESIIRRIRALMKRELGYDADVMEIMEPPWEVACIAVSDLEALLEAAPAPIAEALDGIAHARFDRKDVEWAKQIASELRYMRELIKDDCGRTCFCFVKPLPTALNGRVHGLLDTAAMLLERYADA